MGFSPFHIIYGVIPRCPTALTSLPDRTWFHGDASAFVDAILDVHTQTKAHLETAAIKYKTAADKHRRRVVFQVGDFVWAFLTRERMPARDYNKLKAKKIGPLEILERFNDNAYRVQLPAHINCSDIFNVRFFTPFIAEDTGSDSVVNPIPPEGPDAVAS